MLSKTKSEIVIPTSEIPKPWVILKQSSVRKVPKREVFNIVLISVAKSFADLNIKSLAQPDRDYLVNELTDNITAGYDVITVSKTYKPIRSKTVLFITPDYTIKDAPKSDILVVFGGPTQPTIDDPEVMAWIKDQAGKDEYVMSVCTGAFILGKAGLLDGLTSTTFHTAIDDLAKKYPKTKVLANTRFVDNGKVITTAGISAGIDGALHLVEKLRGRAYAQGVATTIEYDKWVPEQGLVVNAGK